MLLMREKNKKYEGLTGYRLHNERFKFTHRRGIRTIKFLLEGDKELKSELAKKIKQDYESLYGPLNLTTYREKREYYSLKDFWIDSLRAGVIIFEKTAEIPRILSEITSDNSKHEEQRKLMEERDPVFFKAINLKEIMSLASKSFRDNKKKDNLKTEILACFIEKDQYAEKKSEEIANELCLKKKGKDQKKYWKEKVGIETDTSRKDGKENKTLKKSSFYIFPELPLDKNLEVKACLERINKFIRPHIQKDINEKDAEKVKIQKYCGIGNSASGLSNYLGEVYSLLKEKKIQEIITYVNKESNIWKDEEDLRRRLMFLSEQARKLKQTEIVKFQNYRTDFGGKIDSWIKNGFNQEEEIMKQLFGFEKEEWRKGGKVTREIKGHTHELEKVLEEFENDFYRVDEETIKENDTLKDIVKQMQRSLERIKTRQEETKKLPISELEAYRELLSSFKTKSNFLFQKKHGNFDEEMSSKKNKSIKENYPKLFENLRKMPSFVGDVKLLEGGLYDKYLDSYNRLITGIDFLVSIEERIKGMNQIEREEKQEKTVERMGKTLQSIVLAYKRAQSEIGKQIMSETLAIFNCKDIEKWDKYDYVFRSKYSRERRGEKKNIARELLLKNINKFLEKFVVNWEKYREDMKINDWLDFVEIQRIRTGIIAYFFDISEIKKLFESSKLKEKFAKVDIIRERYGNNLTGVEVNSVIQTAILSEMRGTLSSISTKKIISRYVLQPVDVEKRYPLLTTGAFNEREKRAKRDIRKRSSAEKYFVDFNLCEDKVKDKDRNDSTEQFEKIYGLENKKLNNETLKEKKKINKRTCLELRSSKYQIQFLDNSLSGVWKEFKPEISSYSLIYEEEYDICWENEKLTFKIATEKRINKKTRKKIEREKRNLYVSIPINLGFTKDEREPEKHEIRLDRRTKFLGVDIGEYGVAIYLLDKNNINDPEPYMSFIHEPTLRKIREGIKGNVRQQRAGTFPIPNTYVKRIRENAITILRNRIHDIVLKHNAKVIYEKDVDAFESGSGAISKIYKSLKRADVYSVNSIDELERGLVWGLIEDEKNKKLKKRLGKSVGSNVSAYATSYLCSKCHRSIYVLIGDDERDKKYEVKEIKNSSSDENKEKEYQLLFEIQGERVLGYVNSEKEFKGKITGKEIVKAVRDFARPPLKVFLRNVNSKEKFNGENFEKTRGNQGIFICPFLDCNSIMDADKQAAMWIALKGFLNCHLPKKGDDKKNENKYFQKQRN